MRGQVSHRNLPSQAPSLVKSAASQAKQRVTSTTVQSEMRVPVPAKQRLGARLVRPSCQGYLPGI
jgi:hypothetical protein